ncbi:FMN reductase [Streptoalloteichus tenebrarius]|uniref:FMN reductase n=1 Tax=Streptoalloteichus tenebrarius (strain ATCC 17920 / DSM 40477 / JCM 4838 / CBS 697.72 / NBRC 16177 / NCIMB 11028 / NRRL B-12390 / A12253. 1 / ISP 5477) TaxID=1933 RepID=A0ABT1I2S0_STRSD|nr:FMN reductase [Streptoalloteichus tenebrarius]
MAVLVGDPRPRSRVHRAALGVRDVLTAALVAAERPAVAGQVVDAVDLAPVLFDPAGARVVTDELESLALADVLVIASPTLRATYSGLLKALLDHAPPGLLASVVAVPLMVAASPRHAMAVDLHLRPLLTELGASVPGRGLALVESDVDTGAHRAAVHRWLTGVVPDLVGLLDARRRLGERYEAGRTVRTARPAYE